MVSVQRHDFPYEFHLRKVDSDAQKFYLHLTTSLAQRASKSFISHSCIWTELFQWKWKCTRKQKSTRKRYFVKQPVACFITLFLRTYLMKKSYIIFAIKKVLKWKNGFLSRRFSSTKKRQSKGEKEEEDEPKKGIHLGFSNAFVWKIFS